MYRLMLKLFFLRLPLFYLVATSLIGCATNSLTGKNELALFSIKQQIGAGVGSQYLLARYGRDDELEADRFGMQLMAAAGYDPYGAVRLQKKFVALAKGQNSDWLSGLFSSHPPSQQRLDSNNVLAQQLPQGVANKLAYQRATEGLKQREKAYKLARQAQTALANNKPQRALELLDAAIKLEPRQGQFWILRSDAWAHSAINKPTKSLQALNTAIQKDNQYFLPWLKRGQLKLSMRNYRSAEQDLKQSQALLPTAEAAEAIEYVAEKKARSSG